MKIVDNENLIWQRIVDLSSAEKGFLRKEWFQAWTVFNDTDNNWHKEICYKFISNGEDNHVILPYSFQEIGPFKFASLAGNFFPFRSIPNTRAESKLINIVADYITQINGIYGMRFGSVNKSDEFIKELMSCLKDRGWKVTNTSLGYEYGFKLPSNEKEYLEGISSKRRKKIRYYGRKLADCGEVEFKFYKSEKPDTWQEVFKDLATIESNAWISETGEPRFLGNLNQVFWNELVTHQWYSDALSIWILYLNGKPVSHDVAIDTENVRYAIAGSYDEEVAKFRTGVQLELKAVGHAIDEGIGLINSGLGDSGYKTDLGYEQCGEIVEVIAFPPNFRGNLAYILARVKYLLDNLKSKLKR